MCNDIVFKLIMAIWVIAKLILTLAEYNTHHDPVVMEKVVTMLFFCAYCVHKDFMKGESLVTIMENAVYKFIALLTLAVLVLIAGIRVNVVEIGIFLMLYTVYKFNYKADVAEEVAKLIKKSSERKED